MIRQSMFKLDGTVTDIPAKDVENPQREKQVDLFTWQRDQDNLKKLEENK